MPVTSEKYEYNYTLNEYCYGCNSVTRVNTWTARAKLDEQTIKVLATNVARKIGYTELKDLQMEVILSFVLGNDVFAILPTGFGKSLCYACLPGLFDLLYKPQDTSIVIVVTPLIAIMEDQASGITMLI